VEQESKGECAKSCSRGSGGSPWMLGSLIN